MVWFNKTGYMKYLEDEVAKLEKQLAECNREREELLMAVRFPDTRVNSRIAELEQELEKAKALAKENLEKYMDSGLEVQHLKACYDRNMDSWRRDLNQKNQEISKMYEEYARLGKYYKESYKCPCCNQ